MNPACLECTYAAKDEGTAEGQWRCRRYAPRPGDSAVWPIVNEDDWCGDFLPRGTLDESEEPLGSFSVG